jgi:hypothetical protein
MLLLQTHRNAASSSTLRACLTAWPLLVSLRRRIAVHDALWSRTLRRPGLVCGRVAPSRMPVIHQQAHQTRTHKHPPPIEHP